MRRAVRRVHRVSSYGWLHNGEAERTSLRSAVEKAFSSEGGRHERSQGLHVGLREELVARCEANLRWSTLP